MTFLVLNADDFGYSTEVNRAVLQAHQEGLLTSASLMVAEAGFEEAVEIARTHPSLGVGLHLVVIGDRAVLPPGSLPHLIGAEGKFGSDALRAGLRYTFSKKIQAELRQEMEAQFARFAATGLPWSHVDGHQHFHTPPVVWDTLIDLCDRYGVHRLRLPCEPVRAHLCSGGMGPDINSVASLIFRLLRRRHLRRLKNRKTPNGQNYFLCEQVYGHLQTGNMHTAYMLRLLDRIEATTAEIYFHPGTPHARLLPSEEQHGTVRDVELAALLSPVVKARIAAKGFCTGTYAEIEDMLAKARI